MENQLQNQQKKNNSSNAWKWLLGGVIAIALLMLFCIVTSVIALVSLRDSELDPGESLVKQGGEEKLAVINISGVITQSGTAGALGSTVGTSSDEAVENLDRAMKDKSVKAVVLNINSPGGEVVASDVIYEKVRDVREKKPVVAYISSMGASGGYYIAAGADTITIHKAGVTGSIGVILQTMNLGGLYEKLGISSVTFKTGKFKDNTDLFDQDPNGELEQIYKTLTNEALDDFVAAIVDGRGMEESKVRELADGRIYSGKQAVENGLADQLGYFGDAVEKAEELSKTDGLTIIEYRQDDFWSIFSSVESAADAVSSAKLGGDSFSGFNIYYLITP